MTNGAAGAAAAAAAARARRAEEEEMTPYSAEDLARGFEFKILRAQTRAFARPEVLRRVLVEEAQAGWELVEKFDDSRLRFKRPLSARAGDADRPIDPYRTQYGIGELQFGLLILGSILFFFGAIALILFLVNEFT
jgi:hypothetical protein